MRAAGQAVTVFATLLETEEPGERAAILARAVRRRRDAGDKKASYPTTSEKQTSSEGEIE